MELMVAAALASVLYFGYLTVQDLLDDCQREGLFQEIRSCGHIVRAWSSRLGGFLTAERALRHPMPVAPFVGTASLVRVMQIPVTCRLSRNCWR